MSYEVNSYVKDLWQLLLDNKNKLIIAGGTYINPGNFIYYIGQLKELDPENKKKYHDFAIECLKTFIEDNLDCDQSFVNSVEQIITMMRDIRRNQDRNNEPELLFKVQSEDIKQYILNNPKYCKEVFRFLYHQGNTSGFSKYVENVVSVFQDLSTSKNKDHAYKANKMLKDLEKQNKITGEYKR
ncbi:hypothetical protein MNB_SUP05-SYMBIONT-5-1363 [hydrothermal vent metagenome]|uniref:Uncharacterized protein n=1 Tax=hydrothermal vent metagenome TaxID=652676 RepID=A0A1W1E3Z8_9ZZZZ